MKALFDLLQKTMDESEIKQISGSRATKFMNIALKHLGCIRGTPGHYLCKTGLRQVSTIYDSDPADPSWAIVESSMLQQILASSYVKAIKELEANQLTHTAPSIQSQIGPDPKNPPSGPSTAPQPTFKI